MSRDLSSERAWCRLFDANRCHAGVFIIDTLLTTVVGLVLAIVIGIATATALSEFLPRRVAAPLSICIDLLAAVSSSLIV